MPSRPRSTNEKIRPRDKDPSEESAQIEPHPLRDENRYDIAKVSRITGLSLDTLRNWERRYHFLSPKRYKGIRYYLEDDVVLLTRINALIQEGHRIGDLSEQLRLGGDLPASSKDQVRLAPETLGLINDLYDALISWERAKVGHLEAILRVTLSFSQQLEYVYCHFLERLHEDLSNERIGIVEHQFVTAYIQHLVGAFVCATDFSGEDGPVAFVSAVCDAQQESTTLIFSAFLKLAGWSVYYLGPNVPATEVVAAARNIAGSIVCLYVENSERLEVMRSGIKRMDHRIVICGAGVQNFPRKLKNTANVTFISARDKTAADLFQQIYR